MRAVHNPTLQLPCPYHYYCWASPHYRCLLLLACDTKAFTNPTRDVPTGASAASASLLPPLLPAAEALLPRLLPAGSHTSEPPSLLLKGLLLLLLPLAMAARPVC